METNANQCMMFPIYGMHKAAALVVQGEKRVMLHENGVMNVSKNAHKEDIEDAKMVKRMSRMSTLGCKDQCLGMLKMTTNRNGQFGELMDTGSKSEPSKILQRRIIYMKMKFGKYGNL